MQLPWLPLKSPTGLKPVPGLVYLLLDDNISEQHRREIFQVLESLELSQDGATHEVAGDESGDADDGLSDGEGIQRLGPDDEPRQTVNAEQKQGGAPKKAHPSEIPVELDAGDDAESGDMSEREAVHGVIPDGQPQPFSLWRSTVEIQTAAAQSYVSTVREALRGKSGVLNLNPVYGLDGDEGQGQFTYGRRVVVALYFPSQIDRVRQKLAGVGAPVEELRSFVDILPALADQEVKGFERYWVATTPLLGAAPAATLATSQPIADGDALALSAEIGRVQDAWAIPDWIQINVALPQRPLPNVPTQQRIPNADWWLEACTVAGAVARLPAGPTETVAVLDVGFDTMDGIEYRINWFDDIDRYFGRKLPDYRPDGALTMHGTRCAALIANSLGNVPCVAPSLGIMPIRAGTSIGGDVISISDLELCFGLLSAWVAGARVLSASISIYASLWASSLALIAAEYGGMLVVASSGNFRSSGKCDDLWDCTPDVTFPANHSMVTSIGGFDANGRWAKWLQTDQNGNETTTAARWRDQIVLSGPAKYVQTVLDLNGKAGLVNGTSLAAPIVAGIAAVLRTIHAGAPVYAVRDAIRLSAIDGDKTHLGSGRVDATAALNRLDTFMATYQEKLSMTNGPITPFAHSIDWLSFISGLTLGLVLSLFVAGLGQGGGNGEGRSPSDPHLPLPTAYGNIISCSRTTLTGNYIVDIYEKSGSSYPTKPTLSEDVPGSYGYHYDFPLSGGKTYKIILRGQTAARCGSVAYEFTVANPSIPTFAGSFDLALP